MSRAGRERGKREPWVFSCACGANLGPPRPATHRLSRNGDWQTPEYDSKETAPESEPRETLPGREGEGHTAGRAQPRAPLISLSSTRPPPKAFAPLPRARRKTQEPEPFAGLQPLLPLGERSGEEDAARQLSQGKGRELPPSCTHRDFPGARGSAASTHPAPAAGGLPAGTVAAPGWGPAPRPRPPSPAPRSSGAAPRARPSPARP